MKRRMMFSQVGNHQSSSRDALRGIGSPGDAHVRALSRMAIALSHEASLRVRACQAWLLLLCALVLPAADLVIDGTTLSGTQTLPAAGSFNTVQVGGTTLSTTTTANVTIQAVQKIDVVAGTGTGTRFVNGSTVRLRSVPVAPTVSAVSVTLHKNGTAPVVLLGSTTSSYTLTYAKTAPAHGSLSGTAPNLTYTPTANYSGTDSFTYTVSDGFSTSYPATVSLTITATDVAPVIAQGANTTLTTPEDTPVILQLTVSDAENDPLTWSIVQGTLGTTTVTTNGKVTYSPSLNRFGSDTVKLTVSDGTLTATITIAVTITAVNDAPTLSVATLPGGTEDMAMVISYATLLSATGAGDVDSSPVNFKIASVDDGELYLNYPGTNTYPAVIPGTTVLASPYQLIWRPSQDRNGTINAFSIMATDGSLASAAVQIRVIVAPINDAPRITQAPLAAGTAVAGVPIALTTLATDENESLLTYSWSSNGNVSFSPNANNQAKSTMATFANRGTITCRVDVKDPEGLSTYATVQVKVIEPALTPEPSLSSGTFTNSQILVLRDFTPGSTIRYTVDGSEPTATSPLFSQYVLIDHSMTVKACAFAPDYLQSATLTLTYVINATTPAVRIKLAAQDGVAEVERGQSSLAILPTVTNSSGQVVTPTITWAVPFGDSTVDGSGIVTPGHQLGFQLVSATALGVTGYIEIKVKNSLPFFLVAPFASQSPVTGTSVTLDALGSDDDTVGAAGESFGLLYEWSVTAGHAGVFLSPSGPQYSSQCVATFPGAGDYTIACRITDVDGGSYSASVTLTVQSVVPSVTITPRHISLAKNGTKILTPTSPDQFGIPQPVVWSVNGGGLINPVTGINTVYTAPNTIGGPFTVTATLGSARDNAVVHVFSQAPPVITSLTADSTTVAGDKVGLHVTATDDKGEPALKYFWFASGPGDVAFSSNGLNGSKNTVATFTKLGVYTFTAQVQDGDGAWERQQVVVTVVPVPITGGIVGFSNGDASVVQPSTDYYELIGTDLDGNVVSTRTDATWSVDRGSVNQGLVTFPTTSGPMTITAQYHGWVGTKTVYVNHLPRLAGFIASNGQVEIQPGILGLDVTATPRDVPMVLHPSLSDSDVGQTVELKITESPQHGTVLWNVAQGTLTYTPASGYVGDDTFVVRPWDGYAFGAIQRVVVTVQAPVDPLQTNPGLVDGLHMTLVPYRPDAWLGLLSWWSDYKTWLAKHPEVTGQRLQVFRIATLRDGTSAGPLALSSSYMSVPGVGSTYDWQMLDPSDVSVDIELARYTNAFKPGSTYRMTVTDPSLAAANVRSVDVVIPPAVQPTVTVSVPGPNPVFAVGSMPVLKISTTGLDNAMESYEAIVTVDGFTPNQGSSLNGLQTSSYAEVWSYPNGTQIGPHTAKVLLRRHQRMFGSSEQWEYATIAQSAVLNYEVRGPTVQPTIVPKPTGLTATYGGADKVSLKWHYDFSRVLVPLTFTVERWRLDNGVRFEDLSWSFLGPDVPSLDGDVVSSDGSLEPGVTYYYDVVVTAPDGTSSTSDPVSTSIVEHFPTVSLLAPTGSPQVTVPNTMALSAAVDFAGNSGGVLEFLVNGRPVVTRTAAPWSGTWTIANPGVYQIVAQVRDSLGHQVRSAGVSITATPDPNPPGGTTSGTTTSGTTTSGTTTSGGTGGTGGSNPTPPMVAITDLRVADSSLTGDKHETISGVEWALTNQRAVQVEVTSQVSGGTITGGTVSVGDATVALPVGGGKQTVSITVPADGMLIVSANVTAQNTAGTATAYAASGDGISADSARVLVCTQPPVVSQSYAPLPAADEQVDMVLPSAASGKLVFLNANPEDDTTYGNKQLRANRATPFFTRTSFRTIVRLDSLAGLSRKLFQHKVWVGTRARLAQVSLIQAIDGRYDRVRVAGWNSVKDTPDANGPGDPVLATLVDACGNILDPAADATGGTLFQVLIDTTKPAIVHPKSDSGELVDQVTYSSPVNRIAHTGPLAWVSGGSGLRPALEGWQSGRPDGSGLFTLPSGERRGLSLLPTPWSVARPVDSVLWMWYGRQGHSFIENEERRPWINGTQMPLSLQDRAGNFSDAGETDTNKKSYSAMLMPIQGESIRMRDASDGSSSWDHWADLDIHRLVSGPSSIYQSNRSCLPCHGRPEQTSSSIAPTLVPGVGVDTWHHEGLVHRGSGLNFSYKGYADLTITIPTTAAGIGTARSIGQYGDSALNAIVPRTVDADGKQRMSPAILPILPSWSTSTTPAAISIRDEGVLQASKLISGTPSLASITVLRDGADLSVANKAFVAATGYINGAVSVQRSDWKQARPGMWTVGYGISGTSASYTYKDQNGQTQTTTSPITYNNTGYRFLNAIRATPDIVSSGTRVTVTIDAGFVNDTWSWKDFSPTGDYVHLLSGGTDLTLTATQAASATPDALKSKIAIMGQRLVPWPEHPTVSQALELDLAIGSDVAAALYDIDVKLGAIKAYTDDLSAAYTGNSGAWRMKQSLMVLTHQWIVPTNEADPNSLPQPTAAIGVSDPRPVINVSEWTVSSSDSGNVVLQIAGVVHDAVADNAGRGLGADIATVGIEVDGAVVATLPVDAATDGAVTRWRQHPYIGRFAGQVTVNAGIGTHSMRLVTSPNAANNTGSTVATLTVKQRNLAGSSGGVAGSAVLGTIKFPSGSAGADTSSAVLTLVDGSTGTLTKAAGQPVVYNGSVTSATYGVITVKLTTTSAPTLTAAADAFAGSLQFTYANQAQATVRVNFSEDAATSGRFLGIAPIGGGGGGNGQTLTTAQVEIIGSSGPGSYHPLSFRVKPIPGKVPSDYQLKVDGDPSPVLQAVGSDGWSILEGGSDFIAIVVESIDGNGNKIYKIIFFDKNGKITDERKDKRLKGWGKPRDVPLSDAEMAKIAAISVIIGSPQVYGDTDRDGNPTAKDIQRRGEPVVFTNNGIEGSGAVVLLNANASDPSGGAAADCSDSVINGSADLDDLTRIHLQAVVGDIPKELAALNVQGDSVVKVSVKLTLVPPEGAQGDDVDQAMNAIRIFRRQPLGGETSAPMGAVLVGPGLLTKTFEFVLDSNGVWSGPGTTTLSADPSKVQEVYAEGCLPGVQVDLAVETKISRFWTRGAATPVDNNAFVLKDRCRLMTSPVIGLTALSQMDSALYGDGYADIASERAQWLSDAQAFLSPIGTGRLFGPTSGFPQDAYQPAYTAIRATPGGIGRKTRPLLLDLTNNASYDGKYFGVGIVKVPAKESVGPNNGLLPPAFANGGNIECLPSPKNGKGTPLTWIRLTLSTDKTDFDRFFEKRCVPAAMELISLRNSSGIVHFAHVDELLAVVPLGGSSGGFRICLADQNDGINLLGGATFDRFSTSPADIVALYGANPGPVAGINEIIGRLHSGLNDLGYDETILQKLPILTTLGNETPNTFQPNSVNLQVWNGKVALPNPFCEKIRQSILTRLSALGVPMAAKPYLDTWGPFKRLGNLHCATLPFLQVVPENQP